MKILTVLAGASLLSMCGSAACAQTPVSDEATSPRVGAAEPSSPAVTPVTPTAPTASPLNEAVAGGGLTATAIAPVAPTPRTVTIPEGTEVFVRIEDFLSSASNAAGDRFSITLDEEIELAGGVVIPAGYRGVGEVTHAQKRGFMGKAGELNVNLNYIRVGDVRLRLRGSRNREGEGRLGTTVVLTVLFGPLGLLWKGKDLEVPRGTRIPAYVDSDAEVAVPTPTPPAA